MKTRTRVALVESEFSGNVLGEVFGSSELVEFVGKASDIDQCKALLFDSDVNILVIDMDGGGYDGFAMLDAIKSVYRRPIIVALGSTAKSAFQDLCLDSGAMCYMLKPIRPETILSKIESIQLNDVTANRTLTVTATTENLDKPMCAVTASITRRMPMGLLEQQVSNIFISVGIPAHIKGYQFLREAVRLAVENPAMINGITKQLYPTIAQRYCTSASKVERAIRHAIDVAWCRGKIENINSVFGIKIYEANDKPTNGEFIALVADKMLMDGICS